jgi:hypothetical protein
MTPRGRPSRGHPEPRSRRPGSAAAAPGRVRLAALGAAALLLAGCAASGPAPTPSAAPEDACLIEDGALDEAAFVLATAPAPGARVASGFQIRGCSRSFESTVLWRLLARDGTELAAGVTQGGGVDGPGPFSASVAFTVAERQVGHLEVYAEDVSDGEGFPPGRTVLPLVLLP